MLAASFLGGGDGLIAFLHCLFFAHLSSGYEKNILMSLFFAVWFLRPRDGTFANKALFFGSTSVAVL